MCGVQAEVLGLARVRLTFRALADDPAPAVAALQRAPAASVRMLGHSYRKETSSFPGRSGSCCNISYKAAGAEGLGALSRGCCLLDCLHVTAELG